MTLPSRKAQIDAIVHLLDSGMTDDMPLRDIATMIVDGYHAAITPRQAPHPLRVGMLIKDPISNKVQRVAWMGGEKVWIVAETATYGYITSSQAEYFEYCEEYRPKKRVEVDGKGKMVELTDEEIAEAWSNPDWKVGDRVSQHQRQYTFEIIATAPQSVLMRRPDGRLQADGNVNLKKYYRKEGKVEDSW